MGSFCPFLFCLPFFFFNFDTALCSPGWPETCYAVKNDLECLVLLPPESWDHRHVLATTSGLYGLGTEARVLCVRQTLYQPSHIPNLSLLRVSVTHILTAHVAIKEVLSLHRYHHVCILECPPA